MMPHCPNLNDTPSAGKLTDADFGNVVQLHRATMMPAEASTDIGADDVTMPYDGSQRWLGHAITVGCALLSIACAGIGYWLKS